MASIATTDGSLMTMPLPRTSTSVFAVPRSMPMSRENMPMTLLNGLPNAMRSTEESRGQAGESASGPIIRAGFRGWESCAWCS